MELLHKYCLFIKILKIINICQYLWMFTFVIRVNIFTFVEHLLKWIKERENRNGILNPQVLLIKNDVRTFFNAKSYNIQQPIWHFKLFANWYINIPLTDLWEKVTSVQQLQNEHMWPGTPAKVLTYVTHMENSLKKMN